MGTELKTIDANLDKARERWPIGDDDFAEVKGDATTGCTLVVVEESRHDGSYHWTAGETILGLLAACDSNEYAEDWVPLALVDLRDGQVTPLAAQRQTVFDAYHAGSYL